MSSIIYWNKPMFSIFTCFPPASEYHHCNARSSATIILTIWNKKKFHLFLGVCCQLNASSLSRDDEMIENEIITQRFPKNLVWRIDLLTSRNSPMFNVCTFTRRSDISNPYQVMWGYLLILKKRTIRKNRMKKWSDCIGINSYSRRVLGMGAVASW